MQVQPTAMVSMTARWRQGPARGGSGQRRRRTGTWLNTGTLTMLRSSCMVKGFTQPRHRHRASGRSAGMRLGSWLMLRESRREQRRAEGGRQRADGRPRSAPLLLLTRFSLLQQHCAMCGEGQRSAPCCRGENGPWKAGQAPQGYSDSRSPAGHPVFFFHPARCPS